MKIVKKFFDNFRVFFIYIFIFAILHIFLKMNDFTLKNFSKIIYPYFGIFTYIFGLDILLDLCFFKVKDKVLQAVYRIRLLFLNIFIIDFLFLFLLFYVNASQKLSSFNILFTSLNTFKLGYIFTETTLYLYENYNFMPFVSVAVVILLFSFFIWGVSLFRSTIKNSKKKSFKMKSLEERRETLQNKIDIKEALIEDEKEEIVNYNKAQEIGIREQLERARKKKY